MELEIHERDVDSRLCQQCAACCRIQLTIKDTDSRYRQFLRTVGFNVHPPVEQDKADCCEKRHDVTLDMGYCKHLDVTEQERYRCRIYGTPEFPVLCGQYNCVSWAKANNKYTASNATLRRAQETLSRIEHDGQ